MGANKMLLSIRWYRASRFQSCQALAGRPEKYLTDLDQLARLAAAKPEPLRPNGWMLWLDSDLPKMRGLVFALKLNQVGCAPLILRNSYFPTLPGKHVMEGIAAEYPCMAWAQYISVFGIVKVWGLGHSCEMFFQHRKVCSRSRSFCTLSRMWQVDSADGDRDGLSNKIDNMPHHVHREHNGRCVGAEQMERKAPQALSYFARCLGFRARFAVLGRLGFHLCGCVLCVNHHRRNPFCAHLAAARLA
jgi:hypothetical protein